MDDVNTGVSSSAADPGVNNAAAFLWEGWYGVNGEGSDEMKEMASSSSSVSKGVPPVVMGGAAGTLLVFFLAVDAALSCFFCMAALRVGEGCNLISSLFNGAFSYVSMLFLALKKLSTDGCILSRTTSTALECAVYSR